MKKTTHIIAKGMINGKEMAAEWKKPEFVGDNADFWNDKYEFYFETMANNYTPPMGTALRAICVLKDTYDKDPKPEIKINGAVPTIPYSPGKIY